MSAGQGRVLGAVLLAVTGGLLLAAGVTGPWAVSEVREAVGPVELARHESVGGVELAGAALPLGLAGCLAGLALLVVAGRLRRAVAWAVVAGGAASLVVVGVGIARALGQPGRLGTAALAAAAGGAVLTAGGLVGTGRARRPRLPERYDVDTGTADDEWNLASAEQAPKPGANGGQGAGEATSGQGSGGADGGPDIDPGRRS